MKTPEKYSVNPFAESVSSSVASIILAISIVVAIVVLVAGFAAGRENILLGIVGAAGIAAVGLISWASMKMLVNISRSLYNINDALRENGLIPQQQTAAQNATSISASEGTAKTDRKAEFSVGQLVIVLADESQFRIDEIKEDGGIFCYYSKKFDKVFAENELEDFEVYWKKK